MAKKWYFLGFSLIVTVAGLLSILFWHHIPLGVDFKGGTIVTLKFTEPVHEDVIRAAVSKAGVKDARIQGIGPAANNEFIVALEQKATDEAALGAGKQTIIAALNGSSLAGKYSVRDTSAVG